MRPVTLSVTIGCVEPVRMNRADAGFVVSQPYCASWPQNAVVEQAAEPGAAGQTIAIDSS
jgi:hypothetical protein